MALSPKEYKLTITFATLCQIAEAVEAKQKAITINDRNITLSPALRNLAREWRHRAVSLEEASNRVENTTNQHACVLPQQDSPVMSI